MMPSRFVWLSVGGLALLVPFAGLPFGQGTRPEAAGALACPALAGRIGTADRVELIGAGQVLWLERRGNQWGLARQGGYPAAPGRVEALADRLRTVRLQRPAPGGQGRPELAGTAAAGAGDATAVRVLGLSGATLCALVAEPGGTIRRPEDGRSWMPSAPLAVSADAAAWSQRALPPLDPAAIRAVAGGDGLDADRVKPALASLPFADVRPRPHVHPALARVIGLTLGDGTATLAVGRDGAQAWLLVSGTAAWARRLAPYAFALPPDSVLAPP